MDLKYIFDYISKNTEKKSITNSFNYPTALEPKVKEKPEYFDVWLKSIFIKWNDDIVRIGTNNGTLYHAIFWCIDPKIDLLTIEEQKKHVITLCTECYKEFNRTTDKKINMFQDFGYKKLGWKKSTLTYLLKKQQESMEVIRFFADYFNINIIIVDSNDQVIQCHYSDGKFCPYKETIILIRTQTGFDPLIGEKTCWNYNDSFFKSFIKTYKKIFVCPNYSLVDVEVSTRPFELLPLKEIKTINKDEIQDVFNKEMDLAQLQKYAKKYGIPIKMGKKFRTKQMLKDHLKKVYDKYL